MRTEVKIGILAALVVIALGAVFFVNQGKKNDKTTNVLPINAPAERVAATPARTEPPKAGTPGRSPVTTPGAVTPRQPAATPAKPPTSTMPGVARTGQTPAPTTPGGAKPAGAPATLPPRVGEATTPTGGATPLSTTPPGPSATPPTVVPAAPPVRTEPETRPAVVRELPPLVPPEPRTTPGLVGTESAGPPAPDSPGTALNAPATRQPAVTPPVARGPEPVNPATLPPPPAKPTGATRRYTVKENDYLSTIAEEFFKNPNAWKRIADANPGIDPDNIKPGQVLVIPMDEPAAPAPAEKSGAGATPAMQPVVGSGRRYVVKEGDNLTRIAREQLGDPDRVPEIIELNRGKIRDKDTIYVGLELELPAPKEPAPAAPATPSGPAAKEPAPTGKPAPAKAGGPDKANGAAKAPEKAKNAGKAASPKPPAKSGQPEKKPAGTRT